MWIPQAEPVIGFRLLKVENETGLIRKMRWEDTPSVVELIRSTIICDPCFTTGQRMRLLEYARSERIQSFLSAGHFVVYADIEDIPLGFAGVTDTNRRPLFVKPAEQGRGNGSLLLRHMEHYTAGDRRLPEMSTTIRIHSTQSAAPFYEKHGYCEIQRIQYMMDGVAIPRVEMVKTLHLDYQTEINPKGGIRDDHSTKV